MNEPELEEDGDSLLPESIPANVLCDACARVTRESKLIKRLGDSDLRLSIDEEKPESEIFYYRQTIYEAIESRDAGCHLCNLLFRDSDVELYPWYENGVVWAAFEYHRAAWRKGEEGAEVWLSVNFEQTERDSLRSFVTNRYKHKSISLGIDRTTVVVAKRY
ncbi:hypothetical protein B0T20DRAFT_405988 [Sordaria brevicollis]|uniref:Uncharacterized protein n=1 Tax=Sordaria brevicollis TaxID=83679 RepID=A0AAE0UEG6_SORBR|nr:hypothetical protein B0T20DRAFT_405988 [Sordaria brevicollis]